MKTAADLTLNCALDKLNSEPSVALCPLNKHIATYPLNTCTRLRAVFISGKFFSTFHRARGHLMVPSHPNSLCICCRFSTRGDRGVHENIPQIWPCSEFSPRVSFYTSYEPDPITHTTPSGMGSAPSSLGVACVGRP